MSSGVMFYVMLSGCRLLGAETKEEFVAKQIHEALPPLMQQVPGIPAELAAMVHSMLAQKAAERPVMGEVVNILDSFSARARSG